MLDPRLFLGAALLGVGLSMDAFSVALADGLQAPRLAPRHAIGVAATFAFFQGLMPLVGYLLVSGAMGHFWTLRRFVPYIALFLLLFIALKTLFEKGEGEREGTTLGGISLFLQGIATSIDALSVGFTTASYTPTAAFLGALTIAAVTFPICLGGVLIGRKFGTGLSGGASVAGGIILLLIALKIFLTEII